MKMHTFQTLYTETHPHGVYTVEDHGANAHAVLFKSKRMKRARLFAYVTGLNMERIRRVILLHVFEHRFGPAPKPQGVVSIGALESLALDWYLTQAAKE